MKFVIRFEDGAFSLYAPDGARVATGPNPRRLSARAFDLGADEVTHAYDLKLAEDL